MASTTSTPATPTSTTNLLPSSSKSSTSPTASPTTGTPTNLTTTVLPTLETRRKLVLCFDGTNGTFKSNAGDSSIVKLCQLFDRRTEDQYHYYQPGIGTYTPAPAEASYTSTDLLHSIGEKWDLAFGTSFPSHVISGYIFLMRYWTPGSTIHLFGFSRGAYTARFLADMLAKIGLLSAGNEEMIQFAYRSYVAYLEAVDGSSVEEERRTYMDSFRSTYGRKLSVETLCLFDTVGSIAIFRDGFPKTRVAEAKHIRHAISIDERRGRFRPTLFVWDGDHRESHEGSFEEVWFAGDHTDIGGGHYPDPEIEVAASKTGQCLKGGDAESNSIGNVALSWMVQEVIKIQSALPERERLTWKEERVEALRVAGERAVGARWHSNLDLRRMGPVAEKTGMGRALKHVANFTEWGLWWFLEFVPPWKATFGRPRVVPEGATIHPSVKVKIENDKTYRPKNIPEKLLS